MKDRAEDDFKRWAHVPIPSPAERRAEGRRNWFTRMGMLGFVPHPDRITGRGALVSAALPSLFPNEASFSSSGWLHRERWDLLEQHWPEKRTTMVTYLHGMKHPAWALVAAPTPEEAEKILLEHLPAGTHVVPKCHK